MMGKFLLTNFVHIFQQLRVHRMKNVMFLTVCPVGEKLNQCNVLQLFVERFDCPVLGVQAVINPCGDNCSVQFYTQKGIRVSESDCQRGKMPRFP